MDVNSIDLRAIEDLITDEGSGKHCTEMVPPLFSYAAQIFINDLIKKIEKPDGQQISAVDIQNAINTVPEYRFLAPLVADFMNK